MGENLKPCPFCGGEAKFEIYGEVCSIVCQACNCGTPVVRFGDGMSIIELWNRRAGRTCRMVDNGCVLCCSECDGRHGYDDEPNYCSNCGARVVGDDDR